MLTIIYFISIAIQIQANLDPDFPEYLYYDAKNAPYRFTSMDINAKQYFAANGYVVIKNMFDNNEDLDYAKELLWKYLNTIGWNEYDPSTWNQFPGWSISGIIYQYGIGQSELQWFIRTQPKVLHTFASIWNLTTSNSQSTNHNLLTSFDGIGIFRPWKYNKYWRTLDGWFHIDQNIVRTPGLDAVQGLVALTDATNKTGSTVVIGKSHLYSSSYLKDTVGAQDGDFVVIDEDALDGLFKEPYNLRPLMIALEAGDLLLWESRLIHQNAPSVLFEDDDDNMICDVDLLRVVSYVCMTPKGKASEWILRKRIKGYESGYTSNHNPHKINIYELTNTPKKPDYDRNKKLNVELIRELVGYGK